MLQVANALAGALAEFQGKEVIEEERTQGKREESVSDVTPTLTFNESERRCRLTLKLHRPGIRPSRSGIG